MFNKEERGWLILIGAYYATKIAKIIAPAALGGAIIIGADHYNGRIIPRGNAEQGFVSPSNIKLKDLNGNEVPETYLTIDNKIYGV
jgi:hypothetical protein